MYCAVLGSPIAHSLSPVLHYAALRAAGLDDWSYGRVEVGAGELAGFVASLDDSWRGLSLTMPLKVEALEVADRVTQLAEQAGAANTLVRDPDGAWVADNTDVGGFVDALKKVPIIPAAILGSGATARSAVLALKQRGHSHVVVHARNLTKARELGKWAKDQAVSVSTEKLSNWVYGTEALIISTLPAGTELRMPLEAGHLQVVMDVVYDGWPTPLAVACERVGVQTIGGLELLIKQAARQFKLFTGVKADEKAMRAALDLALAWR
ncbi:MAG: shikimate dehydrogenase [Propionibacteriaceae bacterium]|jgi:shikimate dehydrogenase|nr:shikimate dehydrogenase [Propionibacteriaceae bacterium]